VYTAPEHRGGVIEKFVEFLVADLSMKDYKMLYENTDIILLGDIFAAICDLLDINRDVTECTQENKN